MKLLVGAVPIELPNVPAADVCEFGVREYQVSIWIVPLGTYLKEKTLCLSTL